MEDLFISIPLEFDELETFKIYSESNNKYSLNIIDFEDALEQGESPFQLLEGNFYEYYFENKRYKLKEIPGIVTRSKRDTSGGRITPNIYVGTLSLEVLEISSDEVVGIIELEVCSIKTSYRQDYRFMLESITEKCTDLLMQINSPVNQNFETDFDKDNETIYQRFEFIKSIIASVEFNEAVHKVTISPVTRWGEETEYIDIRRVRRLRNSEIKQIATSTSRINLNRNHPLYKSGITTIPSKINCIKKIDIVDTPENRFVKYILEVYLKFCIDFELVVERNTKVYKESKYIINILENHLNHPVFQDVSRPNTLKLNSPILQRKEGYRELLKSWLMFDLASKLIWKGGEDVYKSGKRDIATLYEYWLFFVLLELLEEIFDISPKSLENLIKPTKDGLGLQLKQGKHTALEGTYSSEIRDLSIKFSFNRTFSGNKDYPDAGSWTKSMRPDYTLCIWPKNLNEKEAGLKEEIVYLHFDAKYKIENILKNLNQNNLDEEKLDESKGKYKNADILKMHAYKDAIRRTAGAYVLYPGSDKSIRKEFHEIIPGLGAFPIYPSLSDSGKLELRNFIIEVRTHFLNSSSQRERMAFFKYKIHS